MEYRLDRPEEWCADADAAWWQRWGVPDATPCRTRTEVAWAMSAGRPRRGGLPCRWVTGDDHVGNTPVVLDQMAAAGLVYLRAVPHNGRGWRARPATAVPAPSGKKGRPFTRRRLALDAPAPLRGDARATQVPPAGWQATLLQAGSQGPLVAAVACLRAVAVRDGVPGPAVWVVLRRSLGETPALNSYLCNAPAAIPQATLVWLLGRRWPVAQAIKEGKDDLGMDQSAVRGWRGWHHQLTMTVLAHHFLRRRRGHVGGKSIGVDSAPDPGAAVGDAPRSATGR